MQKQTDNEFYALLNFLPIPVMVTEEVSLDDSGNQVNRTCFVNKAFSETIGYSLEDIPDDTSWYERAYPVKQYRAKVRGDCNRASQDLLAAGSDSLIMSSKIRCKDGSYRWFEVTTELRSSVKPNHNISVFNDVTKLHEMYDDLKAKTRELSERTTEIELLRKIIPICSICKNVKDDQGYWHSVEAYIKQYSDVELSHGLCNSCLESHYPDFYEKINSEHSEN